MTAKTRLHLFPYVAAFECDVAAPDIGFFRKDSSSPPPLGLLHASPPLPRPPKHNGHLSGESESRLCSGLRAPPLCRAASLAERGALGSSDEVEGWRRKRGEQIKQLLQVRSESCDPGPFSPHGSPASSPHTTRRRPPRESRRVSIDTSGEFTQLNQYRLKEAIGQGSYGIVKLAYNEEDDEHYAMKILSKKKLMKKHGCFVKGRLPPARAGGGKPMEDPLGRVYREIAILKKLSHPNVVGLVEVLDDPVEDNLYLVFELMQKGEVLVIPTTTPLPEDEAWRCFRDVVQGLEYLHYQKIIHRDIKPSNLLLSDAGRVVICDFGVCNAFDGNDAFLSSTAGTPAFMAPEALRTDRSTYSGKMADIWSLGVTLFAFVFGRLPFADANVVVLYDRIRTAPLRFPDAPTVSDDLKELIALMLAKQPGQRIALAQIKEHPWTTAGSAFPLPSEEDNCHGLVEVTEEEVRDCVRSIPSLNTLILIKCMLKKHSFCNPFRRGSTLKEPFGRGGRSLSAPGKGRLTRAWRQSSQWSSAETSLLDDVSEAPNAGEGPEPPIKEAPTSPCPTLKRIQTLAQTESARSALFDEETSPQ